MDKNNLPHKFSQVVSQISVENTYIQQTFDYYRRCFKQGHWAMKFVLESERIPEKLKAHDYPCLCDRTLGLVIPKKRTLEGGALRGALQKMGLLLATGGELFRGCLVFPTFDEYGAITSAVGYRYGERIRHWQPPIIYWCKPEPDAYIHSAEQTVQELIYGKAKH